MAPEVITLDDRTIAQAVRSARALPRELRQQFRTSVNREVVAPVAREVQVVAGRSTVKAVRAFRNRGVAVKPGEEPTLVVGGPEPYAGRAKMRTIAFGAEFGGSYRHTEYRRRGRRTGRRRGASHTVDRAVTTQFGTRHDNDGRFVYPTLRKRVPEMTEAFLRIVERVTEEVWTRGND
jgi:hypothetical protein